VGKQVFVAGTAPIDENGDVVAPGDAYLQAKRCLEIIVRALRDAGAAPEHVVRTRMFVRDPQMWEAVGRAHGEIFAHVQPVTTMVFVDFIHPEMMVEIEADAVLD
jgi:enamine deaminase RidA (YjgF/YER057c/UK114 family)